jgi:hypothetical protein
VWNDEQRAAFNGFKDRIAEDAVLALPNDTGQFRLEADASEGATGSVRNKMELGVQLPSCLMDSTRQSVITRSMTKKCSQ